MMVIELSLYIPGDTDSLAETLPGREREWQHSKATSAGVSGVPYIPAVVGSWSGMAMAITTEILFGLLSARRAARLDPLQGLSRRSCEVRIKDGIQLPSSIQRSIAS